MRILIFSIFIMAFACARKSEKPFSQNSGQSPVQERFTYSASVLTHVDIRQGEIEFLENAFNEDRSPMGSCFVEISAGQIQKFKLFENTLEISANGVTQTYRRLSGRAFSIFGKWEHSLREPKSTIISSLLIYEDHTVELTNFCEINRALN
jgi:hypothetical protein